MGVGEWGHSKKTDVVKEPLEKLGQQAQQHLNKGSSHPAEPGSKGREKRWVPREIKKTHVRE